MTYRKHGLHHGSRAALRSHLAAFHEVGEQHLLETIKNRRAFQRARKYRLRSRSRTLEKNPKAGRRTFLAHKALYSGQGELHGLLAAQQMTPAQFCRTFDVSPRTFHGWRGFPLRDWPLHMLRMHGRLKAMQRFLEARGVDLRQFEPAIVAELMPTGRYPRTAAQAPRSEGAFSPSITLRWCDVCRRNTPRIEGAPCTH